MSLSGIPVIAGDRINFIIDPKATYFFDSTKITATINTASVPDTASSLVLLLIGFIATMGLKFLVSVRFL
jgi:hypothetical protein